MFPDGSYGITLQQAHRQLTEGLEKGETHISNRPDNAQIALKALLGKDSSLVSGYAETHSGTQNILTLDTLPRPC